MRTEAEVRQRLTALTLNTLKTKRIAKKLQTQGRYVEASERLTMHIAQANVLEWVLNEPADQSEGE